MHPACQLCRGACCESIVLPALPPGDEGRWLGYHGRPLEGGAYEIPVPCTRLDSCGSCMIHASRPSVCRTYQVGGPACRATIARRRSTQAEAITALLS